MSTPYPYVSLADVCDVVSGATPKTNEAAFWDGDIPWVTPKDLSDQQMKEISTTSRSITKLGLNSCSTRIVPAGSVLLSSRAPIGLVAINTVPMCTNQGFKSLVPKAGAVDSSYLYWWLSMNKATLQHLGRGATFKEISKQIVAELQVPLPGIVEQKRIAAILDAADGLRARREASINELDLLVQSTFLGMFGDPMTNPKGWDEVTFGAVADNSFRNGLSPSTKGTIPGEVLTLTAITTGRFSSDERKAALFNRLPAENQTVSQDTFLICRGNGNKRFVGAGAFPDCTNRAICFPDTMIGVTPDSARVNGKYLHTLWGSLRVRQQIEKAARTTNGTYKINQQMLAAVTLPLPPLGLQARFASFVESVERQRTRLRTQLVTLEALFASLQARAFKGKLSLSLDPSQAVSA